MRYQRQLGGILKINSGCRSCGSENLFDGITLGNIPIAGKLIDKPSKKILSPETNMKVCSDCGLGQLSVDLSPSFLYSEYNWRTSTSASYLNYIYEFADSHIIPTVGYGWVLELASNDGYLLEHLMSKGISVLGVDPAVNISRYAITKGVPVLTEFFNLDLAKEIVRLKGRPKWIIANNVLAHTPDIKSFMEGIAYLCADDTTVTIENPAITNILTRVEFETIFHEHYSYLGVSAIYDLAKRVGISLMNVEYVPPQGGSYRYWLGRGDSNDRVISALEKETELGVKDFNAWSVANQKVSNSLRKFKESVTALAESGAKIASYAASAKSSTVINAAGVTVNEIYCVADDVLEKQGRYIAGANIPVVTAAQLLESDPTHVIIFAHNIKGDLESKLAAMGYRGQVVVWTDL